MMVERQPNTHDPAASSDQVRKLVREEGIEAKNLVSWHVPLNEALSVDVNAADANKERGCNGALPPPMTTDNNRSLANVHTPPTTSSIRVSKSSKRPDFRSRHWSYLFDNLRRTVDAIYDTCFFDQSVIECKEAIMILENCTKDFYALIEYLNNQAVWDKAGTPTAVAWEVRKTAGSPNKHFPPQIIKQDDAKVGVAAVNEVGSGMRIFATDDPKTTDRNAGGVGVSTDSTSAGVRKAAPAQRNRRRPRAGGRSSVVNASCVLTPVLLPMPKTTNNDDEVATSTHDQPKKVDDEPPSHNYQGKEIPQSVVDKPSETDDHQINGMDVANAQETAAISGASSHATGGDDDGWEVVRYARSRRNSIDQSVVPGGCSIATTATMSPPNDSAAGHRQISPTATTAKPPLPPPTPPKPVSRPSVFPKSAQEIRQTKASLGKMAYNRQYLADQRQKEIEDKIRFSGDKNNNRRFVVVAARQRRAFAASGASSISLPLLESGGGCIGINFSNPEAVKKAAQALKASLAKGGGRTRRFRSYQSMESVQSLESIKEEDGGNIVAVVVGKECATAMDSGDDASMLVAAAVETAEKSCMTSTAEEDEEDCVPAPTPTVGNDDHRRVKLPETHRNVDGVEIDEAIPMNETRPIAIEDNPVMIEPDSDEALKHLTEEEESLAQEEESIHKEMEEERKSIDIEMKRQIDDDDDDEDDMDDEYDEEAEDDADEIQLKKGSASCASNNSPTPTVDSKPMSWQELVARWEAGPYSGPSLCWADIVDMELAEVRSPGQAAQVHEKLSSPSRQRNLEEALKKREERRTKAHEMRQQILERRLRRMRELSKRVEEVQDARQVLVERRKALMEERLAKAEENRNLVLLARVKKAHDEDEKVNEIAFINSLEAGNKRLDVMTRQQDLESRLLTIQEERQRRNEEKAAREAAAEVRRKTADERRQTKVLERAERTRKRHQLIEQQRFEQERERQQLAKEKAREREGRLAEMKAAQQANTEELLQRIQQKQEESTRRHEENLEQIKQRASEMSTPRTPVSHGFDGSTIESSSQRPPPSCQPYSKTKLCTVCNILIPSDLHLLAHLKGKLHAASLMERLPGKTLTKDAVEQESQKCIIEASDEKVEALSPSTAASSIRAKANRKRRQRIRQKLQAKTKEYTASCKDKPQNGTWQTSQYLQKISKASREIGKCLENCGLDKQWLSSDVHTLERAVGELVRILSTQGSEKQQQEAFHGCKIQDQALMLMSVLEKQQNSWDAIRLPLRSVLNICNMLKISIAGNSITALDMLYSNRFCSCVDVLASQIQCLTKQDAATSKQCVPGGSGSSPSWIPQEAVVSALICLVTIQLEEIVAVLRCDDAWFEECRFGGGGGKDGLRSRVVLVLSYMVASGIVDQFGAYCSTIVTLTADECRFDLVMRGFRLIATMLKALLLSHGRLQSITDDSTQLLESIRFTDLCNLLPILYSLLLNPNTIPLSGDRLTPPKLSDPITNLVATALELVNDAGAANWRLLQDIFGQEGSSLEFRHVASFLISYGNRYECKEVLHPIIISVGYFTLLNAENQDLVHFGNQPSILQQLCVLPFAYFSDEHLTRILYPTLIACTYRNEANRYLLEQELSCTLLSDFLKQHVSANKQRANSLDVEALERRFPRSEWDSVIEYFDSPSPASAADENGIA